MFFGYVGDEFSGYDCFYDVFFASEHLFAFPHSEQIPGEQRGGLVAIEQHVVFVLVFHGYPYAVGVGIGGHYQLGIHLARFVERHCKRCRLFGVG